MGTHEQNFCVVWWKIASSEGLPLPVTTPIWQKILVPDL
jgi:hypothetical protein